MNKTVLFLLMLVVSPLTYAGYLGGADPHKIYGSKHIRFGALTADSSTTCAYWNRHFSFDATTDAGKNMLSILLTAYTAGKKVDVWYTDSKSPGTDQTNGCSVGNLAVVTAIGFSK